MEPEYRSMSLEIRQEKQCGSAGVAEGYNTGLHIFALFLIMTCGTAACSFPTVVKAFPRLAISRHALFISRHFGTGVLIALAFVHLLPTAFENLWDDCLPYFWTEGYDAMPGFIAMMAALAIMLVEMGFTLKGLRHAHLTEDLESVESTPHASTLFTFEHRSSHPTESKARVAAAQPYASGDQCDAELICPCDTTEECSQAPYSSQVQECSKSSDSMAESQKDSVSGEQKEQRLILQCLLLEAGILFHSVFIGLSISLSTGTTFIALMVAISFHQIFEGLALGARIAAVASFRVSNPKPWAMSFAVSNAV